MKDTHYFAIGIPQLSKSSHAFVQSVRQQYDPRYFDVLPPHFTLFTNLTFSGWELLKNNLQKNSCCRKKITFTIHAAMLVPPSPPHCHWYTFLIPDGGFGALYKLHMHAKNGLLPADFLQHVPFIPHITVGSFIQESDCRALVYALNQSNIKVTGTVDKISLIKIVDKNLQFIDEFLLDGIL